MCENSIPHSVESVVYLTSLLDETIEKRGKFLEQRFNGREDSELKDLSSREKELLRQLNHECERLQQLLDLERSVHGEEENA